MEKTKLYVWPDYEWLEAEEYDEILDYWRGDDFTVVGVPSVILSWPETLILRILKDIIKERSSKAMEKKTTFAQDMINFEEKILPSLPNDNITDYTHELRNRKSHYGYPVLPRMPEMCRCIVTPVGESLCYPKSVSLRYNNYNEVGEVVKENKKTCLIRMDNVGGKPIIKKKKKFVTLMFGDKWENVTKVKENHDDRLDAFAYAMKDNIEKFDILSTRLHEFDVYGKVSSIIQNGIGKKLSISTGYFVEDNIAEIELKSETLVNKENPHNSITLIQRRGSHGENIKK